MNRARENMIASLTDGLEPVRSFRMRDGVLAVGVAGIVTLVGIALIEGLWNGVWNGEAKPFFWVTNGLLLLLGLVSSGAAVGLASPSVGNRHDAPKWAAAMTGVLPIAAIISLIPHEDPIGTVMDPASTHCLAFALGASLLTGVVLTIWLRRGAPVSLNAAGWMAGLAAGALGSVTYGMSCPLNSVTHLGIWHILPVAIAAIVGRFAIPPLVRW